MSKKGQKKCQEFKYVDKKCSAGNVDDGDPFPKICVQHQQVFLFLVIFYMH